MRSTISAFTACKNNTPDPKTYTVSFNANGGSPEPSAQTVTEGEKATEPQDVTKDGYTLDGWYKEVAFATQWNFANDTVTADITLYAKWEIDDPNTSQTDTRTKLNFAANLDFSEMFSDMKGDVADFIILNCSNGTTIGSGAYLTFLISKELVNHEFTFDAGDLIPDKIVIDGIEYDVIPGGISTEITLNEDVPLEANDGSQDPIKMDFSTLNEYLVGFNFDDSQVKAKLFINGSELVSKIKIDLSIGARDYSFTNFALGTSGIIPSASEYTGSSLPAGGTEIDNFASLLNSKEETEIKYKVYMPANTVINTGWLGKIDVVIELLIWVPLYFEAINDDAELSFPGGFMDGVGAFVDSIAEVVDSLSLVIDMNLNPFAEGTLIVRDANNGIEIENQLSETSLNFAINKEDMEKIINADSFEPEFAIVFAKGEHLGIPTGLKITTVSLEATLH